MTVSLRLAPALPHEAPNDDDRALAQAAAAGDRAAAEALVRRLLPRARNLMRYLVRGDRDVDDVAQHAMLAVLRGLSSFRGDGPLEPWADRVVARAARAWLKARSRRERRLREEQPALVAVHREGDPRERYAARRDVVRALDGLPADQRHAVVLHHAVGMTVAEVADATGVSFDTAKSRLRLGMQKLLARLGGRW